jgi:uncharacterized membrane protein
MYVAMYAVHVITAIILLMYLLFPSMVRRTERLPANKQAPGLKMLVRMNRFGQAGLALAFLSGGYMIGKVFSAYSMLWLILSIVLVLVIGAMSGMVARPLRQWKEQAEKGANASEQQRKARTFSTIAAFAVAAIIIIMLFPGLL